MRTHERGNDMYDLLIIGGGPAGLTAGIYARRSNKTVLVIEKNVFGGQITFSPNVENIPGFTSLSGNEFAEHLVDQAIFQGVEFESSEALEIQKSGEDFAVRTDNGEFEGHAVIIATGAKHRILGLEKEEQFIGNGISFCAVCDGAFYKDLEVAVVGGGNSALQEAILLKDLARKVTIFQDLDYLTGEEKLQEQLRAASNVEIITGVHVVAYLGDEELKGITVEKVSDKSRKDYNCDGVFLAVGLVPQNEPFKNVTALNEYGYADADEFCNTITPGIFVAGDCRSKRVRQVATACADGAVAAIAACNYMDKK